MDGQDFLGLFAYSQWANEELLTAAEALTPEAFAAPSEFAYRGIRATLVHTLDVERSWRRRIRGEAPETWEGELPEAELPTVRQLRAAWEADAEEMRAWIAGLESAAFDRVVDLGPRDRYPLSTFLLHVLTHSAEQRRDVALQLEQAGVKPPEIEYLSYADATSALPEP